MISAPVTDSSFLAANMNVVEGKNYGFRNDATKSFQKTLQGVTQQEDRPEITNETKQTQTTKTEIKQKKTPEENIQNETDTNEESITAQETACQKEVEVTETVDEQDTVTAEMKDAIKSAAKDILDKIAETLELDVEDIEEVMGYLNMPLTDVFDLSKLTNLVAELSGTDMMGLITDENLYENLQEITDALQGITEQLLTELEIPEDMLQQVCLEITAEQSRVEVPVPLEISDLSQKMDIPQKTGILTETEQETMKEPIIEIRNDTVGTKAVEETVQERDIVETSKETEVQEQKIVDEKNLEGDTAESGEEQEEAVQQGFPNDNLVKFTNTLTDTTEVTTEIRHTVDTEDIMKQIMDYMSVRVKEDVAEMEMQLHPASLGTVNLQIVSRGGTVTAEFTVQNEAVKNAMEAQIVQLKENIESQGVKIEAIEVTLASHEFEQNFNGQNQEQTEQTAQGKITNGRRRIINLNDYESLETLGTDTDDATRIAMEMMSSNGNSLDMLA